jgi:hypothetical protein
VGYVPSREIVGHLPQVRIFVPADSIRYQKTHQMKRILVSVGSSWHSDPWTKPHLAIGKQMSYLTARVETLQMYLTKLLIGCFVSIVCMQDFVKSSFGLITRDSRRF